MFEIKKAVMFLSADATLAHKFLAKAQEPNIVQALVEVENHHARNAEGWLPLVANQLNDFPILGLQKILPLVYTK